MTDYTTDDLVDRLYDQLNKNEIPKSNKLMMERPDVSFLNKKTYVKNFTLICENLKRNILDVKRYFEDEVCKKTSIDASGTLLIDGRFRPKEIEKILLNYLTFYVFCKECNSSKTELIKKDRITFLKCNKCLSEKAL